jgi:hypothetical protein
MLWDNLTVLVNGESSGVVAVTETAENGLTLRVMIRTHQRGMWA